MRRVQPQPTAVWSHPAGTALLRLIVMTTLVCYSPVRQFVTCANVEKAQSMVMIEA
jgi:hypothetical protein